MSHAMPRSLWGWVVIMSLCTAALAWADVPTFPNVTYATIDGNALRLDLYMPAGVEGVPPLVVWMHGGGWRAGTKTDSELADVLPLLARGIAVASIDYRLTTQAKFTERIFPAQIFDAKGAVRFLRASAETFGIDQYRIGAWGWSAGAHLAALLGTSGGVAELEGDVGGNLGQSSDIMAAVSYAGPTDFFNGYAIWYQSYHWASQLFGGQLGDIKNHQFDPNAPWPDLVDWVESANPITHVSPDDPPMAIFHGAADIQVPPAHSQALHDALVGAGVSSSVQIVAGVGHEAAPMPHGTVYDFFELHLGGPVLPGDFSGDGLMNLSDINPFVLAMTDWPAYEAAYPDVFWLTVDPNGDGAINLVDINPFVALLTGGGVATIPEPASVLLVAGMMMGLVLRVGVRSR